MASKSSPASSSSGLLSTNSTGLGTVPTVQLPTSESASGSPREMLHRQARTVLKLKRGILTKPSWVKGDAQCYGVRKRNVHRRIAAPRDALGISALERKEGAKSRNSPDQTWKTGRLATILGFRRKTKTGRFPETDVKSGVSFDDQCKSRYRPSRSCVKV
ncbi:hypothetical protein BST61_g3661 [Cercospora zeina]